MLCALVLLLSGCSALRFTYGQAPELSYWWLDRYADFDATQKPRVRDGLHQWFAWHRRTQLADYAEQLARLERELPNALTPQRACHWWDEVRSRVDVAVAHGVPIAAGVVRQLGPEQLRHIEQHYVKVNGKFRDEYLQPDPAERQRAAVKRTVERAESLYGRLEPAQRELVARLNAQSPFDPAAWLQERQRRQQDALQVLRRVSGPDAPERAAVEAALRDYAARVARSPDESYRRYAERLQHYNCEFAAAVHNSTTPAQRQTAIRKLEGWVTDLQQLAGEAPG